MTGSGDLVEPPLLGPGEYLTNRQMAHVTPFQPILASVESFQESGEQQFGSFKRYSLFAIG